MEQRVALVTGSTSGIGEAVARRCAADGFHVVVHSGHTAEAGERLAAELGGSYVQADLADADQAAATVAVALAELGRLDVLVNNAGTSRVVPHDDLAAADPQTWRDLLEVNLIAPWALTTVATPYLREQRGCVVNITSHAGVVARGASVPYAAGKAALNHVTRLLAVALGPEVRVNAVAPGLVDTPLTAGWTEAQEAWRERAPMRRAARPADVAAAVADLVASDYRTGEVLVLDGGLHLV